MATQSYVTFKVNGINAFYQTGQVQGGGVTPPSSSILTNIFAAYNADTLGTSLDSSIYAVYNAENNANDSKGTNHATIVGGLTYSTGKIGQAFQFNGSNSYVKPPAGSFNISGDFTVAFWINVTTTSQNAQIIDNAQFSGGTHGWNIQYISGVLSFWNYNNNNLINFSTNLVNTANTWYHVVVQCKSGAHKIYVNNTLGGQSTTTQMPNYITSPYAVPYIGVFKTVNTQWFNGKLDGISIWNRILTDDERTNLYNLGAGTQYPFSSQTLPSSNDSVGTNHGTLVNGTTFTTGKINKAFTFDGVNDYISLADNSMNLTGDFTISLWVYYTITGAQTILSNGFYDAGLNIYKGWAIDINNIGVNNNKITFFIPTGTTSPLNYTRWEFNTPLTLNSWNHIFIKRVGGVETYCWINNVSQTYNLTGGVSAPNILFDPIYHTTNRVSIGAKNKSTPSLFMKANSKIDALTIWNRQLTDDERTYIYNSGNGIQYPFT